MLFFPPAATRLIEAGVTGALAAGAVAAADADAPGTAAGLIADLGVGAPLHKRVLLHALCRWAARPCACAAGGARQGPPAA